MGEIAGAIEAGGKALAFFAGFDLFLVVALILGAVFQIKILPKLIDSGFKRSEKNNQAFAKDILRLTIYSRAMPVLIRMEAAYDFFKLGGNGLTKEFALAQIILPHRELWESVVAKKREAERGFNADKIFEETMLEIKKTLG